MQISPINNTVKQNTNFKSGFVIDIGGSCSEGSCKIRYHANDGTELFTQDTTVNELGNRKFENSQDFIQLLVNKIKRIQNSCKSIVKEKGYLAEENVIKDIAIFLPSYTSKDMAFYLPNHRDVENKPLKDINFNNFQERLSKNGVKVNNSVNFKVLQDALGTGLAMTERLYEDGHIQEGKYYTACITGGGCGIANIRCVTENQVNVESSGSSYLSQSLSLQKVSRAGASAPAVIENFCRAMGFNDEVISDIKACQKAEFTMEESVEYPKNVKTEELKKILLGTDNFEIESEDEHSFTMKIKDEFKDKYQIARRNAIDKYCLALARLAIIKKNEGSNGMIITGKLARAIDKSGKNHYDTGLADWINQHLVQSFNSYELDKMQQTYGFKVICDSRFFIDNNTECKTLVHKANFVHPTRGNWLKLSVEDLKPAVKKLSRMA